MRWLSFFRTCWTVTQRTCTNGFYNALQASLPSKCIDISIHHPNLPSLPLLPSLAVCVFSSSRPLTYFVLQIFPRVHNNSDSEFRICSYMIRQTSRLNCDMWDVWVHFDKLPAQLLWHRTFLRLRPWSSIKVCIMIFLVDKCYILYINGVVAVDDHKNKPAWVQRIDPKFQCSRHIVFFFCRMDNDTIGQLVVIQKINSSDWYHFKSGIPKRI